MTERPAFVLLEDGTWFAGTAPRSITPTFGEVVFTTNLTGYQETFTDPSYLGQIVVMTAPMIGNYGVNFEDMESRASAGERGGGAASCLETTPAGARKRASANGLRSASVPADRGR